MNGTLAWFCVWRGYLPLAPQRWLTFCHGLEVHLAAVAPVACHGACPHLEDIDGAGFEALHSDRVGGAFYGCGVVLTELLPGTEKTVSQGVAQRGSDACPWLVHPGRSGQWVNVCGSSFFTLIIDSQPWPIVRRISILPTKKAGFLFPMDA